MINYNPKNERIKRDYFHHLEHADGISPATIEGVRAALLRFERYHRFKDFSSFNQHQAIAFKEHLATEKAQRSGKPISKATVHSTLANLREFFKWIAPLPGYKSKIHVHDIDYLKPSNKDTRAAKTASFKDFPSLEQVRKIVFSMPHKTDIEKRNRALVAFIMLTGIRVTALVSLKLKHFDPEKRLVIQDPREVNTKFSKQIITWFFPFGEDLCQIVLEWAQYLKEEKLYGFDAPLFPRTALAQSADRAFMAGGLEPQHWQTTSPVREIFKDAFAAAKLRYYNPHSIRHTIGHLQPMYCKNIEECIAWSQNLGHSSPIITQTSYGQISSHRQGEIIRGLRRGVISQ